MTDDKYKVEWIRLWNIQNKPSLTIAKDSDSMYIVGLEGSPLLWIPPKDTNNWLEQVLLSIEIQN